MRTFSADHYFINPQTGKYEFDPSKLGEAHGQCLRGFAGAVAQAPQSVTILRGIPGAGKSTWVRDNEPNLDMVVDNTSITVVEIAPYFALALAYGVPCEVVTIMADPEVAARRNSHGVPASTVQRMAETLTKENQNFPRFWKHRVI